MLYRLKLLLSGQNTKKRTRKSEVGNRYLNSFCNARATYFGWVMVTSASMIVALDDYNNPYFYSIRQGFFAVIAVFLFYWRC